MLPCCLALVVAAAGCGQSGSDAATSNPPTVVVTTGIWADVVTNVACTGEVEVVTLIPDGADPHGFEPSLRDRADLAAAALIVANGFDLEGQLLDPIEAAAGEGVAVHYVAEAIDDPLRYRTDAPADEHGTDEHEADEHGADEHGADEHDEHGADVHETDEHDEHGADEHDHESHGDIDPHVWLDPVRTAAALPALADRLVAEVGLDRADVDACLDAYQGELAAVDAESAALLAEIDPDDRRLITNHDALRYFADRYGFDVVGVVIPVPSGLAETNPAHLAELSALISDTGVPAVFAEQQRATDEAAALADEVGVPVVTLSTGTLGPAGADDDTYLGLLRTNTRLIAGSLAAG